MKRLFLFLIVMLVSGCATTAPNVIPEDIFRGSILEEIQDLQEELAWCLSSVKACPESVRTCNQEYEDSLKTDNPHRFHGYHEGYCETMEVTCLATELKLNKAMEKLCR